MSNADDYLEPIDPEAAELLLQQVERMAAKFGSNASIEALERDEVGYSKRQWEQFTALGFLELISDIGKRPGVTGVLCGAAETFGTYALPTPLFAVVDSNLLLERLSKTSLREQIPPRLARADEVVPAAISEPGAAPPREPGEICAKAERVAGGWLLTGEKLYVPYVNSAERFICVARASEGICAFVVPTGMPEIQSTRLITSNGDPMFTLQLSRAFVSDTECIAVGDATWQAVQAVLDVGALLKAAELHGFGRSALELTQQYVRHRHQFGRPIGAFQAVQHHMADMFLLIEQTRVLIASAVEAVDSGKDAAEEVSLAKIKASEGITTVLELAHQLHGGVGYFTDYPLEKFFRRTIAAQGAYGSARWHRQRLSRMLHSDPAGYRHSHSEAGVARVAGV